MENEIETQVELRKAAQRAFSLQRGRLAKAYLKLPAVLQRMGYTSMRPGQSEIITSVMGGRDTIGILPTSQGKTACYVVPTLCGDFRTLVFSPLVSLMKDQVESLQRYGMSAGQINSSQTPAENNLVRSSWESGELQVLLVAPERLDKSDFFALMRRIKPNMVVVDEAHCVSTWATSFRPAYARISEFVDLVNPEVVLALTATATKHVLNDIRTILGMQDAHEHIFMPRRNNLKLASYDVNDDRTEAGTKLMARMVLEEIRNVDGPTIVYSGSRKSCEDLHLRLSGNIPGGSAVYHAEIPPDEKDMVQDRFMEDKLQVMFATNAFGMGVNKPNIRGIIHRHPPGSLESLTQEMGRAGRDGEDSQCILINDPAGVRMSHYNVDGNYPPEEMLRWVYHYLKQKCPTPETQLAMTGDEIGEGMGLKPFERKGVASALGTLARYKVVSRTEPATKCARVLILGTPSDADFKHLCDLVRLYGRPEPDHYYEIPMDTLIQETGKSLATVQKWIKAMCTEGVMRYQPPFRGKTTRVVGDISLVDFPELAMRREHAKKCIANVQQYARTEDELKHDFLDSYFRDAQ